MTGDTPRTGPLVVLDDDPTGTQAVANVPVLLAWDDALVRETAEAGASAIHLLTNSRASPPEEARRIVRDAASAAVSALDRPRVALRGDSTLRAHLVEEYLAVCEVVYGGRRPPLLLVPALPPAGRVTVGGVHYLERDGVRTPLHETEYAADPGFAYRDARLVQWADDRSGGLFARADGREVHRERLRNDGPAAVAHELLELAELGRPAVCAPDAETLDDLAAIAEGLRLAESEGAEIALRSAPTFVGVLAGNLARGHVPPPPAGDGLLVVCGSYVPSSTRQLAVLAEARLGGLVEVDVLALLADPETEVARAAREASAILQRSRLAIVATPRERPEGARTFEAGRRIALGLAAVAARVDPAPGVVLTKGGITSAVTARFGLGARRGTVIGPLVDGVALWRLEAERGPIHYVVFPGNVGDERTLLEVVGAILGA
jgi:uncharacterized protein YgbK (DUF1537 family)